MTEESKQANHFLLGMLCLLALAVAFGANLVVGTAHVSLWDAWAGFLHSWKHEALTSSQDLAQSVVFSLRLPRAVLAVLCGASLAVAGVVSQGLFRNSLASPSILGTSSGASLGAVLLFYFGQAYWHWLSLPAAAFAGAAIATALVLLLPKKTAIPTLETLLLVGFALNAFLGALTSLCLSLVLEDQQKAAAMMHWLLGGLIGKGPEHIMMVLGPFAIAASFAFVLAPRLDVLTLGEDVAQSLGVDAARLRLMAILVLALLVGGAVAVAGAIPFIGLIVPHMTRLIWGPMHRRLMFWSAINGMTLLLAADLLARTVRSPAEIEVGVLTSLLGAPFFLWLLLSRRGEIT